MSAQGASSCCDTVLDDVGDQRQCPEPPIAHPDCSAHSCRLFLRSYLKTLHLTVLLCLFCAAAYKREHTGLLAACLVSEVHSVFQIFGRMQVRKQQRRSSLAWSQQHCMHHMLQNQRVAERFDVLVIVCQRVVLGVKTLALNSCSSLGANVQMQSSPAGRTRDTCWLQDLISLPYTGSLRKRTHCLELAALALCRLLPAAALTAAVALQPAAFATRARWGLCLCGLLHTDAINARQAWVSYSGTATLSGALHRGGAKAHQQ